MRKAIIWTLMFVVVAGALHLVYRVAQDELRRQEVVREREHDANRPVCIDEPLRIEAFTNDAVSVTFGVRFRTTVAAPYYGYPSEARKAEGLSSVKYALRVALVDYDLQQLTETLQKSGGHRKIEEIARLNAQSHCTNSLTATAVQIAWIAYEKDGVVSVFRLSEDVAGPPVPELAREL